MTETELALADVADALTALALAVLALTIVLIVLTWSVDDVASRVHLFGFMLRRLTPTHPADSAPSAASPAETAVPVPTPAAQKAAKVRSEDHA